MGFFCRVLGHTWVAHASAPEPRWNTTKAGMTLVGRWSDGAPRYFDRCQRCGAEREAAFELPPGARRDLETGPPVVAEAGGDEASEE
jgi:hypothetical protein